MAGEKDTRDMAIQALQKINSHIDGCERRYKEGRESMDRLITFIQEAHAENRKDISQIKDTLAEARGAGKMGKYLGHAITGAVSVGAAIVGFNVTHK